MKLINEANCKFTNKEITACLGNDAKSIDNLFNKIQKELYSNSSSNLSLPNNNHNIENKMQYTPQALQNRINAINSSINNLRKELNDLASEVETLTQYLEVNNYISVDDKKDKN